MAKERLLNHADAEQIATALEDLAETKKGTNDGDVGELPSHDDGIRLVAAIQKVKTYLINTFFTKVDKVDGKGLSTEDFTTSEKNKLAGIASGAEVNVQSDWSQDTATEDDYIKNKPTLGTAAAKDSTDAITEDSTDLIESGAVYSGLAEKIDLTEKGSAFGVAELNANGKVPSSQLPSYVDDVIEGYYDSETDRFYSDSTFETLIPPESGKSWVDLATNKSYRWTGSVYARVDEGVQIGETPDTAYAGNKGKANADAITAIKDGTSIDSFSDVESALADKVDKEAGKGLSTEDYTSAEKTKLSDIESGAQVNTVTSVAGKTGDVSLQKSDVGLGNVGNFKAVSTESNQGLTDAEKAAARANIGAGASGAGVTSIGSLTGDLSFAQIMNLSSSGSNTPDDDMYLIASASSGTTTTWYKRTFAKLWEYINSKISSVLGLTSTTYGGKSSTAGTADNATTADKATKLGTARTIDGVSFDGSASIHHYGTCSTSGSTAEKAVTLSGFSLVTGAKITVYFSNSNTSAAPTLNVNSTGAKSIYINGSVTSATNPFYWASSTAIEFVYSGSYWYPVSMKPDPDGGAWYGTCSTSASTSAKVVSCSNFRLQTGSTIIVQASTDQTYSRSITLNVNSTGAKAVYFKGAATSSSNKLTWSAGDVLIFTYSGSYWQFAGLASTGGGDGGSGTWTAYTIAASGWNSSDEYSFTGTYADASYDILDILPSESATDAQRNAWIAADCGGYYSTNKIKAHGTKPTIDIPVMLCLKAK